MQQLKAGGRRGRLRRNTRSLLWALAAVGRVRAQLRHGQLQLQLPPAPSLPGPLGVTCGLRLRRANCLERALILQRYHRSHGRARDVVIGVRRMDGAVQAHAWLEGEVPWFDPSFTELRRLG